MDGVKLGAPVGVRLPIRSRKLCQVYVLCVLHSKPFFLPVGILRNQSPYRFFNPREIQVLCSQNYAAEILRTMSRLGRPTQTYMRGLCGGFRPVPTLDSHVCFLSFSRLDGIYLCFPWGTIKARDKLSFSNEYMKLGYTWIGIEFRRMGDLCCLRRHLRSCYLRSRFGRLWWHERSAG